MNSSRHFYSKLRYLFITVLVLGISVAAAFAYTGLSFQLSSPVTKEKAPYELVHIQCWFKAPWRDQVDCAELHVKSETSYFVLAVVVLRDESSEHKSDPLVYLQGGPGAGANLDEEGIAGWLRWMRLAQLQRDLILLDPRGTGHSQPRLDCSAFDLFNRKILKENIALADELKASYQLTDKCFADFQLHSQLNPHDFGSRQSATDVRALMGLLNYGDWNLLGVSYGTRLALEIARQETVVQEKESAEYALTQGKTRLKSMVLDSVYPAGFGGVQTWPQVLDSAMQNFFVGCVVMPECAAAISGSAQVTPKAQVLEQRFMAALQHLKNHPVNITVPRWDGEAPIYFLVNDHRFLSASFSAIYNPSRWPQVAAAVRAVELGKSNAIKALLAPYLNRSFSSNFNSLTFAAVDCADNPIQAETDYRAAVEAYPLFSDYTRDQWQFQTCHELNKYRTKDVYLELVKPNVPSLLLAGALDPITPLAWAQQLKRQWPETQLVVRKNLAHSVLSDDVCLLQNLGGFFNAPEQTFTACQH